MASLVCQFVYAVISILGRNIFRIAFVFILNDIDSNNLGCSYVTKKSSSGLRDLFPRLRGNVSS